MFICIFSSRNSFSRAKFGKRKNCSGTIGKRFSGVTEAVGKNVFRSRGAFRHEGVGGVYKRISRMERTCNSVAKTVGKNDAGRKETMVQGYARKNGEVTVADPNIV